MKHLYFIIALLFVSVISTACINNYAIQELNNKAKAYIDNGDSETAICRLQSSLELDDQIYETHYNLGIAYLNAKKYDEAQKQFENTINLKPDFADSYFSYAVSLEEQVDEMLSALKEQNKKPDDNEKDLISAKLIASVGYYEKYISKNPDKKENTEVSEKIEALKKSIDAYQSPKKEQG